MTKMTTPITTPAIRPEFFSLALEGVGNWVVVEEAADVDAMIVGMFVELVVEALERSVNTVTVAGT